VQQWVFRQAEKELTSLAVLRYGSDHRKRWFKNPIHSHFENEVYGDSSTPVRYTLNTVRTLLVAGEEDNHDFYNGTRKLGESMTRLPGRLLLIRNTGHSIYAERPQYFAPKS